MDAYEHWQHEEDFRARAARGEPISEADMLAYCEEKVQFIDEQLSAWWHSYLLGDMTPAALREDLEEIQAITRAAHRYAQQHAWCAFSGTSRHAQTRWYAAFAPGWTRPRC